MDLTNVIFFNCVFCFFLCLLFLNQCGVLVTVISVTVITVAVIIVAGQGVGIIWSWRVVLQPIAPVWSLHYVP